MMRTSTLSIGKKEENKTVPSYLPSDPSKEPEDRPRTSMVEASLSCSFISLSKESNEEY